MTPFVFEKKEMTNGRLGVRNLGLQPTKRLDDTLTDDAVVESEYPDTDEHDPSYKLDLARRWVYREAASNEEQHRRDEGRVSAVTDT